MADGPTMTQNTQATIEVTAGGMAPSVIPDFSFRHSRHF